MPLLISSSPGLECRQKKNCHVRIHCLFRHVLFFGKTWSPAALKKHIQGVHRLFMEIVWVLLWCCCHTLWQIWKRLIFELLIVVYKKGIVIIQSFLRNAWSVLYPHLNGLQFLDTMYTRSEGRKSTKEDHSGLYGVKEEEELNYVQKSINKKWLISVRFIYNPNRAYSFNHAQNFSQILNLSRLKVMITNYSRELLVSAREPLPYFLEVRLSLHGTCEKTVACSEVFCFCLRHISVYIGNGCIEE